MCDCTSHSMLIESRCPGLHGNVLYLYARLCIPTSNALMCTNNNNNQEPNLAYGTKCACMPHAESCKVSGGWIRRQSPLHRWRKVMAAVCDVASAGIPGVWASWLISMSPSRWLLRLRRCITTGAHAQHCCQRSAVDSSICCVPPRLKPSSIILLTSCTCMALIVDFPFLPFRPTTLFWRPQRGSYVIPRRAGGWGLSICSARLGR